MSDAQTDAPETTEEDVVDEPQSLNCEVEVKEPSACERLVVVSVSRDDVDGALKTEYDKLMPEAVVKGFRPGKAPLDLVKRQFKDDVQQRVKGDLLMRSMTQISDELELSAISEPDFDVDAIEIPDEGPLTYEFRLEVRPEFDLPDWKGLSIKRSERDFTEDDVNDHLKNILSDFAELNTKEGPADLDDFVTCDIAFKHNDKLVVDMKDESIRVKQKLSFPDAEIANFGELMKGKKRGDVVNTEVVIGPDAEKEELRNQTVQAEFRVHEVEELTLPEMTEEFLGSIGGFESEEQLREMVQSEMERQLSFSQTREVRDQIRELLTESADWELPPDLLRRQSAREVERLTLELQSSGFPQSAIDVRINELRRNILDSTAKSLKEHFILERIAEEQEIEADEDDYAEEIANIAAQQRESPRRVRALLEKRGAMESLRNHIVERKVVAMVEKEAKFESQPYQQRPDDTETIRRAIAGDSMHEAAIPAAQHDESDSPDTPDEVK